MAFRPTTWLLTRKPETKSAENLWKYSRKQQNKLETLAKPSKNPYKKPTKNPQKTLKTLTPLPPKENKLIPTLRASPWYMAEQRPDILGPGRGERWVFQGSGFCKLQCSMVFSFFWIIFGCFLGCFNGCLVILTDFLLGSGQKADHRFSSFCPLPAGMVGRGKTRSRG